MEGSLLTILVAMIASQFWIVYKLGRLEGKLKKIESNLCSRRKHGRV